MANHMCVAVKLFGLISLILVVIVLISQDLKDNRILPDPEWQVTHTRLQTTTGVFKKPPYTDNISYVAHNNVCVLSSDSDNITAVILVPSHAGNLRQRALVRSTFPSTTLASINLRRVFVLASLENGIEPDEWFPSVSLEQLNEESRLYGDTVRCSFIESYSKLTIKNIMALRWAIESCPHARFVAKMDDENLVNYYKVAEVMKKIPATEEDLIMGIEWRGMLPRRNKTSKYYISYDEYAPEKLPDYMSGLFYWTSMASTKKLLDTAKTVPFFKAEDVFITGMASKAAGLGHKDLNELMTTDDKMDCCKNTTSGEVFECKYMVAINQLAIEDLLKKVSERIEYCRKSSCSPPPNRVAGLECF